MFKRMRLVPLDEAMLQKREQRLLAYDPTLRAASNANDEAQRLLYTPAPMTTEERMRRLADTTERSRELLDEVKEMGVAPAPAPPAPPPGVAAQAEVEERIVQSLPKKARTRAKNALEFLKTSGRVGYDKDLHLTIDGSSVADSNFVDLVKSMYSGAKRLSAPGHRELSSALRDLNMPRTLIANHSFREMLDTPSTFAPTSSSTAAPPKSSSAQSHLRTLSTLMPFSSSLLTARVHKPKRDPDFHYGKGLAARYHPHVMRLY